MQSPSTDSLATSASTWQVGQADSSPPHQALADSQAPFEGVLRFEGHYAGQMEMAASPTTVGDYLNRHQGWFPRCASPMQVSPISDHGYASGWWGIILSWGMKSSLKSGYISRPWSSEFIVSIPFPFQITSPPGMTLTLRQF